MKFTFYIFDNIFLLNTTHTTHKLSKMSSIGKLYLNRKIENFKEKKTVSSKSDTRDIKLHNSQMILCFGNKISGLYARLDRPIGLSLANVLSNNLMGHIYFARKIAIGDNPLSSLMNSTIFDYHITKFVLGNFYTFASEWAGYKKLSPTLCGNYYANPIDEYEKHFDVLDHNNVFNFLRDLIKSWELFEDEVQFFDAIINGLCKFIEDNTDLFEQLASLAPQVISGAEGLGVTLGADGRYVDANNNEDSDSPNVLLDLEKIYDLVRLLNQIDEFEALKEMLKANVRILLIGIVKKSHYKGFKIYCPCTHFLSYIKEEKYNYVNVKAVMSGEGHAYYFCCEEVYREAACYSEESGDERSVQGLKIKSLF